MYLILVIYIVEMWNYFWNWSILDWEKAENVFFTHVAERKHSQNALALLSFPDHTYRLQVAECNTTRLAYIEMVLNCIVPGSTNLMYITQLRLSH